MSTPKLTFLCRRIEKLVRTVKPRALLESSKRVVMRKPWCVCLYLKPMFPGGRTEECVIIWEKGMVDHSCWEAKAQEADVSKYPLTARAH